MTSRTAVIAGASGLVGGHLLRCLLESDGYRQVISVGRRSLDLEHSRLEQRIVADLANVEAEPLAPVDHAYCCLGTTIKRAGSQEAFTAVDHHAVVAFARAARAAGADSFLHITALGAKPTSKVFYNRVKGQAEVDVCKVGFARTAVFRPSILDGDRKESRPGERIGLAAARLLKPILGKYKPTPAAVLARKMVAIALSDDWNGDRVVEAAEILV